MLPLDTGVILAVADTRDPDHAACVALMEGSTDEFVVTGLIVAEAAYLLMKKLGPGAEVAFARSIANGELSVAELTAADWERVADLCETYADLPLGMSDASLIAVAERLGSAAVATLDRRHFSVVVPSHVPAFTDVPERAP